MSRESINKLAILRDRAVMLARARAFFTQRHIVEVDVPILSEAGSIDPHIDLIEATCCGRAYTLHSSPEYGMKRLLSEGMGDIYQLSHVFRDGEWGERHRPEFMMAEWYRLNFTFEQMIEETLEFARLFVDEQRMQVMTYDEVFKVFGGCDWRKLEERDYFFAFEIQDKLGHAGFTVMRDFPPEEAALAKVVEGRALRFEIFYQGLEIANGYHELCDESEQRKRLLEANMIRKEAGKVAYPIDENFLAALKKGLPESTGVAVGFDRLMMLRHQVADIKLILP